MCLLAELQSIQKTSQKLQEHHVPVGKGIEKFVQGLLEQFHSLWNPCQVGFRRKLKSSSSLSPQAECLLTVPLRKGPVSFTEVRLPGQAVSCGVTSSQRGHLFLTYLLKRSLNHTKVTYRVVAGPECINSNKFGNKKSYW